MIDQANSIKFGGVAQPVELFDEAGHFLGYFTPAAPRSLYDGVLVPVSDAELDRIEREGGGRSLAEIMADLEGR
ncbi:MAG TPA: hypothetical protein VHX65_20590 [Pirellulales bacterium]|nr:hypothetical protein [Pirellulales bacterium]